MTGVPRRLAWLVFAIVLAPTAACDSRPLKETGAVTPDPRLEGLTDFVAGSLEDWQLPGLAVAVVVDDRLVFAEGFGIKEVGRSDLVGPRTRFQIGSVTKSFGAAAIGALVDDGLVSWDDPVKQHLPWFELGSAEESSAEAVALTERITLRDLLCHRSGVPEDYFPALAVVDPRSVVERSRYLSNYGEYGVHRYSNLGYGMLGLVVEAVTGDSWGSFVEERLLAPLGMNESTASPYDVWPGERVAATFLGSAPSGPVSISDLPGLDVAMPHGVDRTGKRRVLPWQSYDNMQAAGSVTSTAIDMAQWLRMHLSLGSLGERRVLSETVVAELHRPQVETQSYYLWESDPAPHYAMGWTTGQLEGHRVLSHGGGIFGFPAYAAMLPEAGAGVVVLANGSLWTPYYPHQEIATWVFARLLGLEERDWHAESMARTEAIEAQVEQALAARASQRDPSRAPSLPLERLVGDYQEAFPGPPHLAASLRIDLDTSTDNTLTLRFHGDGAFSGTLSPWHGDTFLLLYDGGDGQAFSSSMATFRVERDKVGARVEELDLGNLGRFRPAR